MFSPIYCLGGLLAVLAWHSHAQTSEPDPSASVSVPSMVYQSPLQSYRRFAPQAPQDWREANATVGRIGGWQAYAAEVWEASQSEGDPAEDETDNPIDVNPHQHH